MPRRPGIHFFQGRPGATPPSPPFAGAAAGEGRCGAGGGGGHAEGVHAKAAGEAGGGAAATPPHPKNKAQTKRLAGWAKGETFMEFFPQSADPIPAFELGKETSGRRCYP